MIPIITVPEYNFPIKEIILILIIGLGFLLLLFTLLSYIFWEIGYNKFKKLIRFTGNKIMTENFKN